MFTEKEIKLIAAIKSRNIQQYWAETTGNSLDLWCDSMYRVYFLRKVLPIVHKYLGDECFYDRLVESTKINYPAQYFWIGQIDDILADSIYSDFEELTK
jgi:hypothetical protein